MSLPAFVLISDDYLFGHKTRNEMQNHIDLSTAICYFESL